jgi:hypothetical protein
MTIDLADAIQRSVLALVPGGDAEGTRVEVAFTREVLGHDSTDLWSGTITGFAQRMADGLQIEEKDTLVGARPAGTASTARAEILSVLQAAGYNEPAALELLARADREPRDPDPDPDFPETLAGGHALVIQYGDCELIGSCQCGRRFGTTTPDASLDTFVQLWERHTNTDLSETGVRHG